MRRINMGTRIPLPRPDGKVAEGYLAKTGQANAPGIVVIQEWWGLQDQITGLCDRLALAGYDALAPDLYGGTVVPYHDSEAANREMSSLDFIAATDQLVRGAAQHLAKSNPKVGLTGFCLGGAVTILGASRIPELAAAVCFYGLPPETAAKPGDLKVPLQGHFANRDDWCTPEAVSTFEAGAKAAGKSIEFHRYEADHGFVNEQGSYYDRKCGELAWERMLAFWKRYL
jgi:carboxymethylenebutenolidase